MTGHAPPPELSFRRASGNDAQRFENFRCSRGAFYEDEVEQFVCGVALEHALEFAGYNLLVFLEGERLVAVAGHHRENLLANHGDRTQLIMTTRLQVLALATEDQGRHCSDGRRVSALVLDTLIHDALVGYEGDVLTAIVARENLRCLALLERHGLRSQVEYDALHVRLSGHFKRKSPAVR